MRFLRFGSYFFAIGLAAAAVAEEPEIYFSDNFDTDTSGNWTILSAKPAGDDWSAVFSYDYSADGIPPAPNASGGTTSGVKLSLNHQSGDTYGVHLVPAGQHFSGDYVLKLDLWINYPGPLSTGGPGSTEFAGFGIGVNGTNLSLFGNPGADGAWFAVDGDGGNGQDYRAYKGHEYEHPSSGQYAAGTTSSARGASHSYYENAFPGGQTAPPLQQSLYPSQTGSTRAGRIGFAWREVEIQVRGGTVRWLIDGVLIAQLAQDRGSGSFQTAGNIALSYVDHNPSISDPDVGYVLFDNVRVEELLPEPVPGNIPLVGHINAFGQQYGGVGGDGDIAVTGTFLNNNTNGVGIYDISDPANPVLAADYNPLGGETRFEDVWVRDGIGYFGCWRVSGGGGQNGVHIVDLSDPYNPVWRASIDPSINGHPQVHTLFLDGDYLYTAAHRPSVIGRTVKVFNISDPYHPVFVRDIPTTETDKVHQITVKNGRLFTSGWSGRTDIFDVSDVENAAVYLGTAESGPNSHSSWPTEDGNVLIVCREIAGGDVRFFDISDPSNPRLMLILDDTNVGIGDFIPHNPVVVGDLLFISWYENGLQVFDISDPMRPVRVGYYATGGSGLTWDGNWGVYPLNGLDRVLLSDMSEGLFIVDASNVLEDTDNYPPLLVEMPVDQELAEGSNAVFSVTVTGSEPMTYQWRRNGSPMPGATSAVLEITDIGLSDGGNYSVTVSNAAGQITSTAGSLTVIPAGEATPPQIHSEPQSQVATPGQIVQFSVTASGTPQLRYQWYYNGEVIEGAEASSLSVGPVLLTHEGNYSVRISNSAGEVLSAEAELTIDDSLFFYDIRVAAGAYSAVVSWKSRVPATGVIEHGAPHHFETETAIVPMHAEFDFTAPATSRVTAVHSTMIGGLPPASVWSFRIVGYTDNGNTRHESPEFLFWTEPSAKGDEAELPDWWLEHFFEDAGEIDPEVDHDGDGWSVWAEFLSGTSPIDPASGPQFSVEAGVQEGEFLLRFWPIYARRSYFLESSSQLGSGWSPQTATETTTDEGIREFRVNLPAGEQRFFRLLIEPLVE